MNDLEAYDEYCLWHLNQYQKYNYISDSFHKKSKKLLTLNPETLQGQVAQEILDELKDIGAFNSSRKS